MLRSTTASSRPEIHESKSIEISQEAFGAQGFVSAPGWAKIENGTRQPSDELLKNSPPQKQQKEPGRQQARNKMRLF
jgi:hypothetical protein